MTGQLLPLHSSHVELDAKWVIRVDGRLDQSGGDFALGDEVKDGEEQERLVRGAMVGQGRSTVTVPVRSEMAGFVQIIGKDMYRK